MKEHLRQISIRKKAPALAGNFTPNVTFQKESIPTTTDDSTYWWYFGNMKNQD